MKGNIFCFKVFNILPRCNTKYYTCIHYLFYLHVGRCYCCNDDTDTHRIALWLYKQDIAILMYLLKVHIVCNIQQQYIFYLVFGETW